MSHNVGLKIYPNTQEMERITDIARVLPLTHPLEIGFYTRSGTFCFPEEFIQLLESTFKAHSRRVIHLSTRTTVFTYAKSEKEWQQLLGEELELAERLQGEYCVIHDSKWPPSISAEEEFIAHMAKNAKIMKEFSSLPLYMENTFKGVAYYRKVFRAFDYCLNFTFDIGHTRVWSQDDYETWFAFLEELDREGVSIHFHIHTNHHVFDEHLAFTQMDDPKSVEFIKLLQVRFPQSTFILEIQQDFEANLNIFSQIPALETL